MSDSPPSPPGPQRRRSSIADLFAPRVATNTSSSTSTPTTAIPRPQHSRGMSVSTAGLGGSSPPQSSPFTAFAKQRRASVSTSSGSGSPEFRNSFPDEAAVTEEGDTSSVPMNTPVSPSFARRVSFGAQALRDVKGGGTSGGGGRRPSSSLFVLNENAAPSESSATPAGSSRTATTTGEGFNWSDALRDKTKRSPSFSSSANPFASNSPRNKSTSFATAVEPPKEMPKAAPAPRKMNKPDQLGERMLRGEFMMD